MIHDSARGKYPNVCRVRCEVIVLLSGVCHAISRFVRG